MTTTDVGIKRNIAQALAGFGSGDLAEAARALLATLGYQSDRRIDLSPNTSEEFIAAFDPHQRLNPQNALVDAWTSVDFLFQLTGDEIRSPEQGRFVFDADRKVDKNNYESYLFFAIGLQDGHYTRT